MVVSNDWTLHLVRKSGASPEQQIAASLIVAARESCAAGNPEDCRWLASYGLAYLSLICPDDVDEHAVLVRLLADLPQPESTRGWYQNAESFMQMLLSIPLEQEAPHGDGCDLPETLARTRALARGDPLRSLETATVPSVQLPRRK